MTAPGGNARAHGVGARTPVVNVVGATATGKSDLAIELAHSLGGEVINGDAMQFYRGMDIGTAKLPPAHRGGVPHHLLDFLDVTQEASVADFQHDARALIARVLERGRRPILVGGSGLYVRAATDVMEFPGTDPVVRARLESEARAHGTEDLHARLRGLDPLAAAKIASGDTRRIVRALEVVEITGRPFSAQLPEYTYALPTVQIGLAQDRTTLHERIERRVRAMFDAGWIDEVRRLEALGLRDGKTAKRAIGYGQILDHLDGLLTLDEAVESTIVRTRQFAKRQETWFKRDPRINWLPVGAPDLLERALETIAAADAAHEDDGGEA